MKGFKLLLLVLAICLASGVKAQFYSSERVYCYQYEKTIHDGISSKQSKTEFYFVNFQNDMMGYTTANGCNWVGQKIVDDPNYFDNAARADLANKYEKWKSIPDITIARWMALTTQIISFCREYSSGKYTYRELTKASRWSGNIDPMSWRAFWGDPYWGNRCYSFSTDRREMIVWSTNDTENRDYYKLVDASSLKPNTDFLE